MRFFVCPLCGVQQLWFMKPKCTDIALCAILLLTACSGQSSRCACDTPQVLQGLQTLYNVTGGPSWNRSRGWAAATSVCGMDLINCYSDGSVEIFLQNNHLVGTLPPAAGALLGRSVLAFVASNNVLSGTLPPEYAALTDIRRFNVDSNRMSGHIPENYSAWTRLAEFKVFHNEFSGTISPTFSKWSNLERFAVNFNILSGTIPPELAQWSTTLWSFAVDNNLLSGSVPMFLAWSSLKEFYIHRNAFTGTIDARASTAWAHLRVFAANLNQLWGTLPEELGLWSRLEHFDVSENHFSGTLSTRYSMWPLTRRFNVAYNRFTGTLPSEYSNWPVTVPRDPTAERFAFNVSTNLLNGTLPPEYKTWRGVSIFDASSNEFSGFLPGEYSEWADTMRVFRARNNILQGTLPPQYSQWVLLYTFDVSNNIFVGTLPTSYGNWTMLGGFYAFDNTGLSGSIPVTYGVNWVQLIEFAVMNASLSGPIPPALGRLSSLRALRLNNNNLSGTLPLLSSAALVLYNNRLLTGSIPAAMPATVAVSICNTSLCGTLPSLWRFSIFVCTTLPNDPDPGLFFSAARSPPTLPACESKAPREPLKLTTPPANQPPRSTLNELMQSTPGQTLSTIAVITAASASAVGGSLHVSLHTFRLKQRTAACISQGAGDDDEAPDAIGDAAADNSTRLTIPGRMPTTAGAVIGNCLLLIGAPCLAAAGRYIVSIIVIRHSIPQRGISKSREDMTAAAVSTFI